MSGRSLKSPFSQKRIWVYLLCLILFVYVLVYMPTPYVINAPGVVDELKPIVHVTDGDPTEKGTFMLTTVSIRYANAAMLLASLFDPYEDIGPKPAQNDREDYAAEQLYYMSSSQSNAIAAAYKKAGVAFKIEPQYVFVVAVPQGDKMIYAGDKFVRVDGQNITSIQQLEQMLSGKKAGDTVDVVLDRAGTNVDEKIKLTEFQDSIGRIRVGFGVAIGEVQKVTPDDPAHEVKFADTNIGGPSAGLMFSLEIYNQLTPGDLTRGYRIAGTGTIDPDGTVGIIGGVQHKIVAAQNKGAEIFLVPQGNYADAKAELDRIHSTMKLIPVKTMDDALKAIAALPAKS
ncbi:PDZ domain-containing protein [Paenibacillus campi]|uniref:YlbL family protein n=1 Tax=Paenibacillus campi TaxID=3106031 RepID=UPI002AFFF0D7|nr:MULTISPECIES: PDZ domain-containing protein [unclassified Paenibacillus]